MILDLLAFGRGAQRQVGKTLIFAILLTSLTINGGVLAQKRFSREQFSRLNVRNRAAFFENEILRAANKEGIDPNILWTIAYNETRFRPWLRSPKNAQGLMQFIPATAARFDLENPSESVSAIRAAARYVKVLSNLFSGRVDSILAAYNSGEGTVSAYFRGRTLRTGSKIINPNAIKTIGGVPPYTETVQYVGRGLKIYRWLILRGVFPASSVRFNFPTVISQSVARVRVFDRELGNLPAFNNFAQPPRTQPYQVTQINNEITAPNTPSEEQKVPSSTMPEVYDDSHSGSRYLLNNGEREMSDDAGIVVIDKTIRPETTNQARSTFCADLANK